ncbi:integrin alpha-6-like [Plectropomus leopardus]|uniref:integrin alpha-6-like n=1 Tax=Plectropomus leopardus TaxID=160734 RepID=UPI001C4AEB41|nr:integrin alpha-6-like [Plectropomus leopardus]
MEQSQSRQSLLLFLLSDFAVGAPYDDNNAGKVYIYHGAVTGLSSETAAQVLSGKSFGVKQFGYSLAGNMDLDKNSYPDLAVGSLSDSVFVFKSRPVIDIKKEITFTPKEIDLTKKNCGNNFCLEVETCLTYTASPENYTPKLTVEYSLEADADHKKSGLIPRAILTDSKGTITINSKGKKECFKRELTIPENIRDKLRGIPIDVSVDIKEAKRKRRQSSTQPQPVLDPKKSSPTRSMLNFRKEGCGSDNVCQSNLQMKYRYGYMTADGDTFTPLDLQDNIITCHHHGACVFCNDSLDESQGQQDTETRLGTDQHINTLPH